MDETMDRRRQPAGDDAESSLPGRSAHLAIETLSAYLDHALAPADHDSAEAHLATCEACRQELRELAATVTLLGALPQPVPRRSFQLSPTQIRARLPWWQRLGERLLPRVPALRAATVAVTLLLVAVTTFDLLSDGETTAPTLTSRQPTSLATSLVPQGALTQASEPGQAQVLPTSTVSEALAASQPEAGRPTTVAGRTSQISGSEAVQSASNMLAAEPVGTPAPKAAGRVDTGNAPGVSVDTTAITASLDQANTRQAAPREASESEQPALPMEAASEGAATAMRAEIMSVAEEGVAQEAFATPTEPATSAFLAAASPAPSPAGSTGISSTPLARPSPAGTATTMPGGDQIQGSPDRGGWSEWRIAQVMLAMVLIVLLLTLVALQRLRARRAI